MEELLSLADHHALRGGFKCDDVERLTCRNSQAPPLADCKARDSIVLADDPARCVHQLPWPEGLGPL